MDISSLETYVEKILLEIGITPDKYEGVIILSLCIIFGYSAFTIFYFKLKCSNLSCREIKKIYENSEKAIEKIEKIEVSVASIITSNINEHDKIHSNVTRVESALSDTKDKISEINGIIMAGYRTSYSQRKRITHEDEL